MATNSWAQTTDVAAYTGVTVTDAQVMQAQVVMDMCSARTYDAAARVGSRDLYWLKLATAFQAVWMAAQPDFYSRLDFKTVSTGNRSVELKDQSLLLGPLALRALRRCSWMRSRSFHVRSPFTDGVGGLSPDPDSSADDAFQPWEAM